MKKLSEETKKKLSQLHKKYNKYVDMGDYYIGYTKKNQEFFIDKKDYDLIYQYCWHRHGDGYLRTCYGYKYAEDGSKKNNYILMHDLIMLGIDKTKNNPQRLEVDHIDGNPNNNRRSNLRITTHSNNMKNIKLYSSNTSGTKGVHWSKLENKWKAYIRCNNVVRHLGTFVNKDDAINARRKAEEELFADYSRKVEDLNNGTR